jgi:hypothetical protein
MMVGPDSGRTRTFDAALEHDAATVLRYGADLGRLPFELEAEGAPEELDRAIEVTHGQYRDSFLDLPGHERSPLTG